MAELLSDFHKEQLKKAFTEIDVDNSGKLTTEEIKQAIYTSGHKFTNDEIQEIVDDIDADGDGEVDLDEFIELMARKIKDVETEIDIQIAFTQFDKDKDGFISKQDFIRVNQELINEGKQALFTEKEIDSMIDESDIDKDSKLSPDEFRRLIMSK